MVSGVLFAGVSAGLAGFDADFGQLGGQGAVLRSQALQGRAQLDGLGRAFGAIGHAGVASGEQAHAVGQAKLAGVHAVGSGFVCGHEGVVRGCGSGGVSGVVVLVFGGGGASRQGGNGNGSSAADKEATIHFSFGKKVEKKQPQGLLREMIACALENVGIRKKVIPNRGGISAGEYSRFAFSLGKNDLRPRMNRTNAVMCGGCGNQGEGSSSTSNFSVAWGGITPPAPYSP